MTALSRRRLAATGVLVLAVAAGCHAQEDTFYATVFTCSAAGPGDQCGHTRDGRPMTCFAGSQLGGDDFCAEACDPHPDAASVADPKRFVCLQSGALVQICHPGADASAADDPSFDCPAGQSCYRTDLFTDVGICLSMRVCSDDHDCTGSMTCATTVVHDFLKLTSDHLQCLVSGCISAGSECPSGEACLGAFIATSPITDDLCVPKCDQNLHCPPNYACANNPVSAPGAPQICVPGVVGARCVYDQDCFAGSCVNFGLEFNVCAFPYTCTSDADCALAPGTTMFVCAGGPPTSSVCTTATVFNGADCKDVGTSSDCAPGTGLSCFDYSPYTPILPHGECRMPCRDDGTCPSRGGIPHTCLGEHHEGGCYPGVFGMPCSDPSQCLQGLSCEAVPPDPRSRSNYSQSICTIPCAKDDDCRNKEVAPGDNYCSCAPGVIDTTDGSCRAGMGFCRIGGWETAPCERNEQCASQNCNSGTCIPRVRN